jgi:trk system potassium uptake protein
MSKSHLINPKIICKVIGQLILIESLMMLVCLCAGFFYHEGNHVPFLVSMAVTTGLGLSLIFAGRGTSDTINRRESYLVVALSWIIFSLLGTMPLLLDGHCDSMSSAFFESMSGFTTTGATIMPDVEVLPHSILLWRTLTHWIGGLGIVFFTMTILPSAGGGEGKLFLAESIGLRQEKLHAKFKTTAAWIWTIYISLTMACALCLWLGGMGVFDSINHAMTTISTGGFSTHNAGIASFNSPAIEYIMAAFMFLGGINFYLLYTVGTKRTLAPIRHNSELRFYILVLVAVSLICAICLYFYNGYDIEKSLRTAFFDCIAINTTAGFTIDNYQDWYHPTILLIGFLTFTGACSGSSTGGFKCIRMLVIMKATHIQFKRILHPNAVIPVQINKKPISHDTERNVMSLLFWFMFIMAIGAVALMCLGISGYDSCSMSFSCFCNAGINFGHTFGPEQGFTALPDTAKWICSFLMLAGRLEVIAILLPFTRTFWSRQ